MSWSTFLDAAPAADHAVQVYDDLADLCTSVGRFSVAGFRAEEPVLLIVTADRQPALLAEIEANGWETSILQEEGLLNVRDADQLLASFMDGSAPSPVLFDQAISGLIDQIAERYPGKTIRAFGEMVEILWQRGSPAAAIELEELWNELAATRRFALLCGYRLDIFDVDVQRSALPEIVRVHTHPRPAADPAKLATAVDRALTEIVGPFQTGEIYLKVAEEIPRTRLPRAQAVLMWLSERDAPNAKRVLDRARRHYSDLR